MSHKEKDNPYIALVLQGGGALGAYHVGAFRALQEIGYTPNWVSGVSIGSINAAIIAGNAPDEQLGKLEELWNVISRPAYWENLVPSSLRSWYNAGSAMQALFFGQPNFSTPYFLNPYFAPAGSPAATSLYDNSPLRATLERMTNFDIINAQIMRLTLGVTRVRTGNVIFFDNTNKDDLPIGSEHVIASTAIPPMFAGVRVKGELYWDGGIVDNTPLEPVLADQDKHPQRDTLVFMIDLWDGSGPEPRTMDEVLWRQNQIQFASRTDRQIRQVVERENMQRAMSHMAAQMPSESLDTMPQAFKDGIAFRYGNLDIVRITYHPRVDQTALSYVDFSRWSVAQRRADGYADMKFALQEAPWLRVPTDKAASGKRAMVSFGADAAEAATRPRAAFHHISQGAVKSEFPGYLG